MFFIYHIAICAELDYGSVLYSNVAKANLGKLEWIQSACCGMILWARKSASILSLLAESFLLSLDSLELGYRLLWGVPDYW